MPSLSPSDKFVAKCCEADTKRKEDELQSASALGPWPPWQKRKEKLQMLTSKRREYVC